MPTKPLEKILYRELSIANAKEVLETVSPLMEELVNYATNAFARCATSTSGKENEDLAVLMLYLHIIEMTDGIEVLLSESCPIPAIPLARSSFEALISIEYILESDYINRSLAWLLQYIHEYLGIFESLDPSTDRGHNSLNSTKADDITKNIELPEPNEVRKWIKDKKDFLNTPQMQSIESEYQKNKTKRKSHPHWYSLFGGPNNFQELATRVGMGGQYEILYRRWSMVVHAGDPSRYLAKTENGEKALRSLRDPTKIKDIAMFTVYFILEATRKLLGKFRPEEEWFIWYEREIRQRYKVLTG